MDEDNVDRGIRGRYELSEAERVAAGEQRVQPTVHAWLTASGP